jgi:hypothetical protein
MSWIPGWESITGTGWWSNFYFWAGIISLLFLGVSEVISHRYTERKDELVAQQQVDTQRRHNEEIARLHLETANANARAKEAELALVKFRAPRLPNKEQLARIAEKLKPFAGTKFDVGLSGNSGEQADFLWRLESALANLEPDVPNAGWIELAWGGLQRGNRPASGSVAAQNVEIHLHPESREKLLPAANGLISVLKEIGIEAKDAGFNAHSTNVDAIHILIGDKR